MKASVNFYRFICISAILVFTSCSSDDSSDAVSSVDYYPLEVGNNWTYENEFSSEDQEDFTSRETLSVSSVSMQGNQSVYQLESDLDQQILTFTSILTDGNLSKSDGQLIFNGTISLNLGNLVGSGFDIEPINIDVSQAVLYDSGAESGDQLFTLSDQITRNINFNGNSVPLNIDFTLESVQDDFLMAYSVNNTEYNDVLSSNLNLTVEAALELFISVPVIDEQEIVTTTNYYAADTGLIFSQSQNSIETNAIEELNVPSRTIRSNVTQELQSNELQ